MESAITVGVIDIKKSVKLKFKAKTAFAFLYGQTHEKWAKDINLLMLLYQPIWARSYTHLADGSVFLELLEAVDIVQNKVKKLKK